MAWRLPSVDEWRACVVRSTSLKPADKLVALAYAQCAIAGMSGVSVPPTRLTQLTSLRRTAFIAARKRLEAAGWLTISERARQHYSTQYALTLPEGDAPSPRHVLLRSWHEAWLDTEDEWWFSDVPDLTAATSRWPTRCDARHIWHLHHDGEPFSATTVYTRRAFHTGRHAYGVGDRIAAVWQDAPRRADSS